MPTLGVDALLGKTLIDASGGRIGKISDVYLDSTTRQPEWALVTTGLFGRRESFVPLAEATVLTDGVHVPYAKDLVRDAPNAEPDGNLTPEEEDRLHRHYSLDGAYGDQQYARSGLSVVADTDEAPAHDEPMPDQVDRAEGLVRSEEQVRVTGSTVSPTETVRLRKIVVTDEEQITVQVRREKLVVDHRSPDEVARDGDETIAGGTTVAGDDTVSRRDADSLGDAESRRDAESLGDAESRRDADLRGDTGTETGSVAPVEGSHPGEIEIILHEERPVVTLEIVATERVRVRRESVTTQDEITTAVRQEHVEVDRTAR